MCPSFTFSSVTSLSAFVSASAGSGGNSRFMRVCSSARPGSLALAGGGASPGGCCCCCLPPPSGQPASTTSERANAKRFTSSSRQCGGAAPPARRRDPLCALCASRRALRPSLDAESAEGRRARGDDYWPAPPVPVPEPPVPEAPPVPDASPHTHWSVLPPLQASHGHWPASAPHAHWWGAPAAGAGSLFLQPTTTAAAENASEARKVRRFMRLLLLVTTGRSGERGLAALHAGLRELRLHRA